MLVALIFENNDSNYSFNFTTVKYREWFIHKSYFSSQFRTVWSKIVWPLNLILLKVYQIKVVRWRRNYVHLAWKYVKKMRHPESHNSILEHSPTDFRVFHKVQNFYTSRKYHFGKESLGLWETLNQAMVFWFPCLHLIFLFFFLFLFIFEVV